MVGKKSKLLAVLMLSCTILSGTVVYASGLKDINVPDSNTSVTETTEDTSNNSGYTGDGGIDGVFGMVQNSTDKFMSEEGQQVGKSVSDWLAKPVSICIMIFLGSFFGIYTLSSVLDLFIMASHFIKQFFGVGNSSQGMSGDSMSGGKQKGKFQWASDECLRAISESSGKSSSGSSGGLEGGSSSQQSGGLVGKNMFVLYAKYRGTNALLAFLVSVILLTPIGMNILMVIATFIIDVLQIVTIKMGEVTREWTASMSQGI